MADGWRRWFRGGLRYVATSLEVRPVKKWSQKQQRTGISIAIAVAITCSIWLFILMFAGLQFVKSHDVEDIAPPDVSIHDQSWWPCRRGEDFRASDLCAQWKAADAARKSAEWTIIAFVVGTIVNVLTLFGVGFGWRETKSTSDSAKEQVKIAKVALSADTRAWMSLSFTNNGGFTIEEEPYGGMTLYTYANLANLGNSPATGVVVETSLVVTGIGSPEIALRKLCADTAKRFNGNGPAFFPGQKEPNILSTAARNVEFLEQRIDQFELWSLYLIGCVAYKTPHVDQVCVTGVAHLIELNGDRFAESHENPVNQWPFLGIKLEPPESTIAE